MHWSQRYYGERAELTVDDIWQITDAGEQELRRLANGKVPAYAYNLKQNERKSFLMLIIQ